MVDRDLWQRNPLLDSGRINPFPRVITIINDHSIVLIQTKHNTMKLASNSEYEILIIVKQLINNRGSYLNSISYVWNSAYPLSIRNTYSL